MKHMLLACLACYLSATAPLRAVELIDQSSIKVESSSPSGWVSVIVKLDMEPVATYSGTIKELAATQLKSNEQRLSLKSKAVQDYLEFLNNKQDAFAQAVKSNIPQAKLVHRYNLLVGGASLVVPADKVAEIARLPGVVSVHFDEALELQSERSWNFLGANALGGLWSFVGGAAGAGQGMIIGIVDSGIYPEHPSFADPSPISGVAFPAPPQRWLDAPIPAPGFNRCQFTGGFNPGAPFTCNNKLIGAYRFMSTFDALVAAGALEIPSGEFSTARDSTAHGTTVASVAAGNPTYAALGPNLPPTTTITTGIAPRAHVVAYKVCRTSDADDPGGCFQSDSITAIERAIADSVDVINYSIATGSTNPLTNTLELAFEQAYRLGVFVATAAGNSGPGANTINKRGPWATVVGSSTHNRQFLGGTLTLTRGEKSLQVNGASSSGAVQPARPIVLAVERNPAGDRIADNSCLAESTLYKGNVVVCTWDATGGLTSVITKGLNVALSGGVGMVLLTTVGSGIFPLAAHYVPTIHLVNNSTTPPAQDVIGFLGLDTAGVTAGFTQGNIFFTMQGDVVANSSSRGGTGFLLSLMKPDVIAPGFRILAADTPERAIAPTDARSLYRYASGTSFASPQVAGAAAVIKQAHPDWSPGRIRSALMLTARTDNVFLQNGTAIPTTAAPATNPAGVFDRGSGRIDLARANNPGLTLDEDALNFRFNLPYEYQFRNHWHATNYPSLYMSHMPNGWLEVQRTVRNERTTTTRWRFDYSPPKEMDIQTPFSLLIPPGQESTFTIRVDSRQLAPNESRTVPLFLVNNADPSERLHFPLTIVRRDPPGGLSFFKSCSSTELRYLGKDNFTDCIVHFENRKHYINTLSIVDQWPTSFTISEVSGGISPGFTSIRFEGGISESTMNAERLSTTAADYPTLASLGVVPINCGLAPSGTCDNVIFTFTLTDLAVTYNGQSFSAIAHGSDGYVRLGTNTGGTNIRLSLLPDAAAPDNLLAAFLTDLHPLGTDGLGAGRLYRSCRAFSLPVANGNFCVIEWEEVKAADSNDRYSFQVWLGLNGVEDIRYVYRRVDGSGARSLAVVGAQDDGGEVGTTYFSNGPLGPRGSLPAAGDALRVNTVPGSQTMSYRATAHGPGSWQSCADLSSNFALRGVTWQQCVRVDVQP